MRPPRPRRSWHRWAVVLAFALPLGHAHAEQERVHHEYFEAPSDAELTALLSPATTPESIFYDGEVVAAPRLDAPTSDGALEAPPQRPGYRPDRITDHEGTLGYAPVFTPLIAPFKRVTSLDTANRENGIPVLALGMGRRQVVPVEQAYDPAPDGRPRDRFWGNVVVDFSDDMSVPFPSVSPESRILSLRTEPAADIQVQRDEAGNYYAALLRGPAGPVRIVFLTDAPRSYFAAPRIPEVRADVLSAEVRPLDADTRAEALRFAAELGLSPDDDLPEVLNTLTAHFRGFVESSDPPEATGQGIFLDLARAQRGVCRHRAYGFMLTAQALGIPTHFVHNEAHAWVEVRMPDVGWMRIDLGGATGAVNGDNLGDQPFYQPTELDPLPRPPSYEASAGTPAAPEPSAGTNDGGGGNGEESAAQGGGEPTPGTTAAPSPDATSRRPLRIFVDPTVARAYRGRLLQVRGRALDPDGEGVGGLRIEVALQDQRGRRILLGAVPTEEDGRFGEAFALPTTLEAADYRLLISTPGSGRYLPAAAR